MGPGDTLHVYKEESSLDIVLQYHFQINILCFWQKAKWGLKLPWNCCWTTALMNPDDAMGWGKNLDFKGFWHQFRVFWDLMWTFGSIVISKKIVSPFSAGADVDPPVSPMDKTKVFYIAVGVACSIIFIIALAVAAIHVHSMPNPNSNKDGAR